MIDLLWSVEWQPVNGVMCTMCTFAISEMPCNYNVRLGSSNWLYDSEGNHVDVSVQAIYRHPDYSMSAYKLLGFNCRI